jgi:hypothetical protein
MTGLPVAAGVEDIANPDMVALALRRHDVGLRSHLEPSRFPGARVLVPLGPTGKPVVTESFRTVPVFSDLEALQAWAQPPLGFPPDPELEPSVTDVGTLTLPDGIDELLAGDAWVVVLNPDGPGACHLAGVVGETPLKAEDLQDPPAEKGFLGRSKGAGPNDPRVKLADRGQLRDRVGQPLREGLAARDAGDVAGALKLLRQADQTARQVGAHMTSVVATLHAARLLIDQGDRAEGSGHANMAGMGSNRHAKPRLQLEGLLIVAEDSAYRVQEGKTVAAGAAAWTADWLRRLADVALQQGSLSTARHAALYEKADQIAATYNSPLNNYDPEGYTPQGWRKAHESDR